MGVKKFHLKNISLIVGFTYRGLSVYRKEILRKSTTNLVERRFNIK
jgi:hypothetical protein